MYLRWLVAFAQFVIEVPAIRAEIAIRKLRVAYTDFQLKRLDRKLAKLGYKIVDDEIVPM